MKNVRGMMVPDGCEQFNKNISHQVIFGGKPTYQFHKLRMCMPFIVTFRRALDVGAHCGLFSNQLSRLFEYVHAFEPSPRNIECWMENVTAANVCLHQAALGERNGMSHIEYAEKASGNDHLSTSGVPVRVIRIDDCKLDFIDFIKIDVEGFESAVLEGGKETILRCKPAILIEQKMQEARYGLPAHAASSLLESWGAKMRVECTGDRCFSWDIGKMVPATWAQIDGIFI